MSVRGVFLGIAGMLLLIATPLVICLFTVPDCTVTTFDGARVTTQYCPPAITHGWHIAESFLIGAWTVFGFFAAAETAWMRRQP